MLSAANVSQTLRRTEWKSLLKRLPRTLAESIDEERNRMNLHPDPQFDPPGSGEPFKGSPNFRAPDVGESLQFGSSR